MRSRLVAVGALLAALGVAAAFWPGGEPPAPDQAAMTPTSVGTPPAVGPSGPVGRPPTDVSNGVEVRRDLTILDQLIGRLGAHVARGEAVEAELLQAFIQTTASLAEQIKTSPESIARPDAVRFIQAAADGRTLLSAARADSGAESELHEARAATHDGVRVASEYFAQRQVETSNGP